VATGHVTQGPHLLPGAHGGLLQSFGRLELALPLVEGAEVLKGGGHRGAEEEEEHLRRRTTQEEEEEEEGEGEHLRRRTTQEEEEEEEEEGEGEEDLRKRTIKEKEEEEHLRRRTTQEEEENFLFFRDVSISDPECSEVRR